MHSQRLLICTSRIYSRRRLDESSVFPLIEFVGGGFVVILQNACPAVVPLSLYVAEYKLKLSKT